MKQLFVLLLLSLVFLSCNLRTNRTSTDSDNNKEKEIPKVLLEEKDESSSRIKSSNDLVEEIYDDILKNNEKLKKLDESINENNKKMYNALKDFEDYKRKSAQYYSSAESGALNITDSILSSKVKLDIANSKIKYEKLIQDLSNADSLIRDLSIKIKENYKAFKIQKTLPVIEKYQKEKIVNGKTMDEFIQEEKKLLERIK